MIRLITQTVLISMSKIMLEKQYQKPQYYF